VWHGTADAIVVPLNSGAIVDQWRDRVGLGGVEGQVDTVDGQRRTTWRDGSGKVMIERYDIAGMGHGTPLATRGTDACGQAGPHMLEAGICSTSRIAASWGLKRQEAAPRVAVKPAVAAAPRASRRAIPAAAPRGVGAVIEDALRAAGLMR
jgi:poly(3-hydroxybutyrate) depolymerase